MDLVVGVFQWLLLSSRSGDLCPKGLGRRRPQSRQIRGYDSPKINSFNCTLIAMEHIATFFLPEDDMDLDAISTREISINRLGESYLVYPFWLVPGKLQFDCNNWLAKQYGLDKPLLTLDHFPSYNEMVDYFADKTILPVMREWSTYGFKFINR